MRTRVLGFLLAPILGVLGMVIPVLVWPPARQYEAALVPVIRDAVEGIGPAQLLLLFAAGAVLALVSTSRAWVLGALAISPLPLVALAEMIKDPKSHNLLPLEFAFYALYSLLVASGVAAMRRMRRPADPVSKRGERVV